MQMNHTHEGLNNPVILEDSGVCYNFILSCIIIIPYYMHIYLSPNLAIKQPRS